MSELRRREPNGQVLKWFSQRPAATLYLSVLTMGEIRKGVENKSSGPAKLRLMDWLETELPTYFAGRILPVDVVVADRWGRVQAEAGRPVAAVDSLLAATALVHGLTMVTRNRKDFQFPGLQVIDPWDV